MYSSRVLHQNESSRNVVQIFGERFANIVSPKVKMTVAVSTSCNDLGTDVPEVWHGHHN